MRRVHQVRSKSFNRGDSALTAIARRLCCHYNLVIADFLPRLLANSPNAISRVSLQPLSALPSQ